MRKFIVFGVLLAVLFSNAVFNVNGQTSTVTMIKAGKLIDTIGGKVLTNQMILIEGERIKAVGANLTIPAGAKVIDLSNATVVPGFIDTHVHLTGDPSDSAGYYDDIFRKSFVDSAITCHIYAKRTLDAGFTSVRNVGAEGFVDVALKNAINEGKIPGPRMQVATY